MSGSGDCLAQVRKQHNKAVKLVLSVIDEVVKDRIKADRPPTAMEYFGTLMSSLEPIATQLQSSNVKPSMIPGILKAAHAGELMLLLNSVILHISPGVLHSKADACLTVFVQLHGAISVLSDGETTVEQSQEARTMAATMSRHLLTCIGTILAQVGSSKADWEKPVRVQALHIILRSLADAKPKTRRAAQASLRLVFFAASGNTGSTPAIRITVEVVTKVLKQCSLSSSIVTTLQFLGYLPTIIPFLVHSKKGIHDIVRALFPLIRLGHSLLALQCLRTLEAVVTNGLSMVGSASFQTPFVEYMVKSLLELYGPSTRAAETESLIENDPEVSVTWLLVTSHAFGLLKEVSPTSLSNPAPGAVASMVSLFCVEKASVNAATASALQSIVTVSVESMKSTLRASALAAENKPGVAHSTTPLLEVVNSVSTIVSPQYQHAWPNALLVTSALFSSLSRDTGDDASLILLRPLLERLVKVRESVVNPETGVDQTSPPWKAPIEKAIGSAISSLGAEGILTVVPLGGTHVGQKVLSPQRAWLVPLLRENLKETPTQLSFFRMHVLELANGCFAASKSTTLGAVTRKVLATRGEQLWALFPCFATRATDIAKNAGFKAIARTLAEALGNEEYPALTEYICKGLELMIDESSRAAKANEEANDVDDEWDSAFEDFDSDVGDSDSDDDDIADDDGDAFGEFSELTDSDGKTIVTTTGMKSVALTTMTARRMRKRDQRRLARAQRLASAPVWFSAQDGKANELAISKFAKNFLPLLLNLYDRKLRDAEQESGTNGATSEQALLIHRLIGSYASVAPQPLLQEVFGTLAKTLVESVSKSNTLAEQLDGGDNPVLESQLNEVRFQSNMLTSVSIVLVKSLDLERISILYKILKPSLEDPKGNAILQKRANKVLEVICTSHPGWIVANRKDLIELMQSALTSTTASAKTARLHCLKYVIRAIYRPVQGSSEPPVTLGWDEVKAMVAELLGEVILCTKEPNNKARAAAFKVILEMAKCLDFTSFALTGKRDVAQGGGVGEYLRMLIAGLAAKTPHMRSATVVALSRVISDYGSRPELQVILVEVMRTTLLLLNELSREVAKACFSFAKVCVVRVPLETVHHVLGDMISGLLPWAGDTKNRFSLKIRVILEKLVKKFGVETVLETGTIPEDHKVIVYIRKQQAYKKRKYLERLGKLKEGNNNSMEAAPESGEESEEDEVDKAGESRGRQQRRRLDGTTVTQKQSKSSKQSKRGPQGVLAGVRIAEDGVLDPDSDDEMKGAATTVDLLDPSALGKLMNKNHISAPSKKRKGGAQEDEDFPTDERGRLVIPDERDERRRGKVHDEDSGDESEDEVFGGGRKNTKKARFANGPKKSAGIANGSEYRSKKAKGDIRKKGQKFEPYAHVPLNVNMLNKRKKHEASRQFKSIVSRKQGPLKGAKAKRANK